MVSHVSTSRVNTIPMQDEYKNALEVDMDMDKKIVKLSEFNELAYKDFILFIDTSSSVWKVAFRLVWNEKSVDFFEENCNITWNRLVSKYAPHTALSMLKLKSKFHSSKLELIEKDPDKWISNLEGLLFEWANLDLKVI